MKNSLWPSITLFITKGLCLISLSLWIPNVWAESAPVYDADALPPQFDEGYRQARQQDYPPPPAPGEEQAFVPMTATNDANNPNPSTNAANKRMEALQNEVQTLRGQVEQLAHQLDQAQQQQKNQYQDLDQRLGENSKTNAKPVAEKIPVKASKPQQEEANEEENDAPIITAPKPKLVQKKTDAEILVADTKPSSVTDDQPNVEEEQQVYQTAFNLIKSKKYNEAIRALQGMLKKYPRGQFAANAHYWLGMLYDLTKKPDLALEEFSAVVKSYPNNPRVADAQLKVGLIYAAQFKWTDAKSAFKKVTGGYPGSSSARVASEQLKQIKLAGH